ncbi:hypothetical protein SAMN05444166_2839 [Singulisphaera sp. GP187]|uniref:hypothetical protein n=1 Tax=Singulisphaera sp. GP187 TaxID=1882752 RepID=UPI00092AD948|nr:hypothetical protein [Singulisphaera sp. GP187]SIO17731.1 hypothetical protein SAMN05444166_2839 [Singulisphaera sp. GP187]
MRNVYSGVIWFMLISGALFAVASQVERPEEMPRPESAPGTVIGHPKDCLACKTQKRGQALPDEIDEKTVWLGCADNRPARR